MDKNNLNYVLCLEKSDLEIVWVGNCPKNSGKHWRWYVYFSKAAAPVFISLLYLLKLISRLITALFISAIRFEACLC